MRRRTGIFDTIHLQILGYSLQSQRILLQSAKSLHQSLLQVPSQSFLTSNTTSWNSGSLAYVETVARATSPKASHDAFLFPDFVRDFMKQI